MKNKKGQGDKSVEGVNLMDIGKFLLNFPMNKLEEEKK